jgi:hypothetical protein
VQPVLARKILLWAQSARRDTRAVSPSVHCGVVLISFCLYWPGVHRR